MIKPYKIAPLVFLTAVLSLFIGCSSIVPFGELIDDASEFVIAPTLDAMPPNAAVVTRAIGNRMGGYVPSDNEVRLEESVQQILAQSRIAEPGFKVFAARLSHEGTLRHDPATHFAAGFMNLQDPIGRRTGVIFETRYQMDGQRAVVKNVMVRPWYVAKPRNVCFVLPANTPSPDRNNVPRSYTEFYRFAGEHAVDPQAMKDAAPQGYLLTVFFLDKISPTAEVRVAVAALPERSAGYSRSSRYLNYNGWAIGLCAGRLALNNPKAKGDVYLKANFTRGEESDEYRREKLIGLYPLAAKY